MITFLQILDIIAQSCSMTTIVILKSHSLLVIFPFKVLCFAKLGLDLSLRFHINLVNEICNAS